MTDIHYRRSRGGGDTVHVHINVFGKDTTLEDLIDFLREKGIKDVSSLKVQISGHAHWEEPATQEELDAWAVSDARREKQRRRYFEELKKEFEPDE